MLLKVGLKENSVQNGGPLSWKIIFSLVSFLEVYGEQQSRYFSGNCFDNSGQIISIVCVGAGGGCVCVSIQEL